MSSRRENIVVSEYSELWDGDVGCGTDLWHGNIGRITFKKFCKLGMKYGVGENNAERGAKDIQMVALPLQPAPDYTQVYGTFLGSFTR